MSKNNILVTGGLGYIGSHTVIELFDQGFHPIIIDNLENTHLDVLKRLESVCGRKLTFEKIDLRDDVATESLFDRYHFRGIIHFAAYKSVNESVSKPLAYYRNNVSVLIKLLEVAEKRNVNHFIFSSSCSVYGQADRMPIKENAPFKEAWSPYGHTKQMGEKIIQTTCPVSSLRSIILRYFNPIGAHSSSLIGELPLGIPSNLVPFITQTAQGIRDKLYIFGKEYPTEDGTCIRDYIHIMDLARAHVFALQRLISSENESEVEIYNLGTGKGYSVLEVVKKFETATGQKINYKFAPQRTGDIISAYADSSLAYQKMGWKTEKSIDTALLDAWNWQKALSK